MQIALVWLAVAANLVLITLWGADVSFASALIVAPVALLAGMPLLVRMRRRLFRAAAAVVALLYLALVPLVFLYALGLLPSAVLLGVSAAIPSPQPAAVRRRATVRVLSGALLLTAVATVGLIVLGVLD